MKEKQLWFKTDFNPYWQCYFENVSVRASIQQTCFWYTFAFDMILIEKSNGESRPFSLENIQGESALTLIVYIFPSNPSEHPCEWNGEEFSFKGSRFEMILWQQNCVWGKSIIASSKLCHLDLALGISGFPENVTTSSSIS